MGGSAFKLCLAAAAVGAGAFTAPATSLRQPTSLGASGHAVIVQNKGGGHGEIGYHLAKALAAKDLDVTIVQDASATKEALPFKLYDELSATVAWCDMGDAAAVEKACAVDGLTHVYDNFAKSPADAAPMMAAAKSSDAFYAFVSSAGMYTAKGILKEEKKYIYGPYTNKRDYLDWFLNRAARDIPMAVPADAQQPVSLTHCEDVAALMASVVGKEGAAADQIFNCGTNKMCSYDDVCIAAAKALGKSEALVAMDVLEWPGATHDVLADLAGFYTEDFLALGLDKGDLDTSKDMLDLRGTVRTTRRGVHV
ncbi:NAD dependent epimerase [Aureococcus anophagefferens]|nr:NAD dependent epimerase [Aureococcus anophagefferens]